MSSTVWRPSQRCHTRYVIESRQYVSIVSVLWTRSSSSISRVTSPCERARGSEGTMRGEYPVKLDMASTTTKSSGVLIALHDLASSRSIRIAASAASPRTPSLTVHEPTSFASASNVRAGRRSKPAV